MQSVSHAFLVDICRGLIVRAGNRMLLQVIAHDSRLQYMI